MTCDKKNILKMNFPAFHWEIENLNILWKAEHLKTCKTCHTFQNIPQQDRCHKWSTRPNAVSPVENIISTLSCFARFWKVGTDGRTTCAKTMTPTGRDCGLAEWIILMSLQAF